jgi:hypothetical protein
MVQPTRRDLLLAGAAAAGSARGALPRPNFLFPIADNLTYRGIHSPNNPEVRTPNLDRVVKRGCTFTRFHQRSWSGAVCIASRTTLNTGLKAFRARKHVELGDELAALLKSFGGRRGARTRGLGVANAALSQLS